MESLGFTVTVTSGVRTTEQQQKLYRQGREEPGKIVTHLDGITRRSNHQPKTDGYGHAIDVVFIVNGRPSWEESNPWELLGAMARSQGLNWGGDWTTLRDRPHLELPDRTERRA